MKGKLLDFLHHCLKLLAQGEEMESGWWCCHGHWTWGREVVGSVDDDGGPFYR